MSQDIINNRFLEESVFAIADGYCVINLSKNIVRGSMYQVVDGKVYNLNEQLGMPENSNLQILVDAWALTIPEEGREDFLKEFNRESLLNRFENGERHISDMYPQYWTPSIGVFLCDTVISTKRSVLNCTDILQKIHAGRVAAAYRMCYDEVQNFKRSDEF